MMASTVSWGTARRGSPGTQVSTLIPIMLPEKHAHQRVDDHLALHPHAHTPDVLLDRAEDEHRPGGHVQDERASMWRCVFPSFGQCF
eukprot:scaffold1265_cov28-Phaeocystis_antarctica.AAC.1